jgi:hypothetical protein
MSFTTGYLTKAAAVVVSATFIFWFSDQISQNNQDFVQPLLTLPAWLGWFIVVGLLTTYVLRGWRVAYEFREYPELSLSKSIQIVLWHNASLNFLPFRSGEVAFPFLLRRVAQVPLMQSMASLTHLRMQDASTVLILGIAFWPKLEWATRLLVSGLVVLILIGLYRWLRRPTDWQDSTSFIKRKVAPFRHAMATGNPNALQSWLLTVSNWGIKISVQAALYCYLANIDFSAGVMATISSEVAAFSPVQGIAGIGTFEVSSALAMYADGVSWATGIQVAAQVHLVMLSSALFWAIAAWLVSMLKIDKTR